MDVGFTSVYKDTLGIGLVNFMTDALCYIDGNHDTLADRACPVPAPLIHYKNYYCQEKRKRIKIDCCVLNEETLRNHSTTIMTLCDHYFSKENSGHLLNRFVTPFHICLISEAIH